MGKGIALGLLLAALGFAGYWGWENYSTETESEAGPKTVEQLRAEISYERRQEVRANPEMALAEAKPENYPAFLAYLDLGEGIAQPAVDDYRQIFNRVASYFGNDTQGQVMQAVFRIHEAKQYFYGLTYRQSLEYLQGTVPASFREESTGRSPKPVRQAADELHNYLVASYMQPQLEAMQQKQLYDQQMQQLIDKNVKAAQARGAAYNASRARMVAEHNRRVQRNIDREYNNYRNDPVYNRYRRYR